MLTRVTLVISLAASAVASAQPVGAEGEVLFRQGRELLAAGKLAEACAMFAKSQEIEPATTTLLNHAGCREKLGELATAWALFLQAERATRGASDAASIELHDLARDRAAKLEPRVSRLTIDVPQASRVAGLEVLRGSEVVAAMLWNQALPVDGGTYTITVRAPGMTAWMTRVEVARESDAKVVHVPALQAAPVPRVEPSKLRPAAIETHDVEVGPSLVLPITVASAAVVLAGSALVFELAGRSSYDEATRARDMSLPFTSLENRANHQRYAAEALAVAGLAATGVAVWLFVRRHSAVAVTPSGVAVTGSF